MTPALKNRAHRWFVRLSNPKSCGVDPDFDKYEVCKRVMREEVILLGEYSSCQWQPDEKMHMTYRNIGILLAAIEGLDEPLSEDRIKRIERRAILKLRHPYYNNKLKGLL